MGINMVQERNVIGAVVAAVSSYFVELATPMRWMIVVSVILIVVDFRFGISAAQRRGEDIRFSRAVKRTINKIVDYMCWIFLASGLDRAFSEATDIDLLGCLVMAVIYAVEISSCYTNYFESKGRRIKIDVFGWMRNKTGIEITELEKDKQNDKQMD